MYHTPHSSKNGEYSNQCHRLAQDLIYPDWVGVEPECIQYEDTLLGQGEEETALDGKMAVDRRMIVRNQLFRQPFEWLIQERFRRPKYANYRDITVTEWNNNSNLPSELYKIKSGYFVYGYANHPETPTGFLEVMIVEVASLLWHLQTGELRFTRRRNGRSGQDFINVKFDDLLRSGCAVYHKRHAHGAMQPSLI